MGGKLDFFEDGKDFAFIASGLVLVGVLLDRIFCFPQALVLDGASIADTPTICLAFLSRERESVCIDFKGSPIVGWSYMAKNIDAALNRIGPLNRNHLEVHEFP